MKLADAVWLGIFAINTFMHPDASAPEDLDKLEANEEEARDLLVRLASTLKSDIILEVERDQVEALLRYGEIGTTGLWGDEEIQQYIKIRLVGS